MNRYILQASNDVISVACPASGLRAVRRAGNWLPTGPVLLGQTLPVNNHHVTHCLGRDLLRP